LVGICLLYLVIKRAWKFTFNALIFNNPEGFLIFLNVVVYKVIIESKMSAMRRQRRKCCPSSLG